MNRTLAARLAEAQSLSDADQVRLADILGDFIDTAKSAGQFENDMKDPAYRAYVEGALEDAEADRQAGRVKPLGEALDTMIGKFKAQHGL